ncbi:MAG TPA: hypothetical protein VK988_10110 [Acidimicrobiales bacterium]|nr:hypothetical protein [Acidimicrobiales bacterium]
MRVEALLVADRAVVENGLLSIEGGGWEHYQPPLLPWTLRGSLAGVLVLEDAEVGSTPAIGIEMTDSDGHVDGFNASMIVNGIRPTTLGGVPCRVPLDVPFTTVARAPTVVKIGVVHAGTELASVTFAVREPVPDTAPDQ